MLDAIATGAFAPAGIGRRSPILPRDAGSRTVSLSALAAQSHLGTELRVVTREGDVVTLDWSRDTQVTYARGRVAVDRDGDGSPDAVVRGGVIERSVQSTLSFEVEGDLNEQELADLRRVMHAVRHALREFARGDFADAAGEIAGVRTSGSLASVQAEFEASFSLQAVKARVESAVTPPKPAPERLPVAPPAVEPAPEAVAETASDVPGAAPVELLERLERAGREMRTWIHSARPGGSPAHRAPSPEDRDG